MLLESAEAFNFRNLHGGMRFGPELNIFVGENGQGKTNWLEAIGVLALTRSFRTAVLRETIGFDQQAASLRGEVRESPEIVRELQVVISANAKELSVNGKKETAQ